MNNIHAWLDGTGMLAADAAIGMLLLTAGVCQWWLVVMDWLRQPVMAKIRVLVALGYTVWATRILFSVALGIDPIIAPIASIAIALVAGGSILISVARTCHWVGKSNEK